MGFRGESGVVLLGRGGVALLGRGGVAFLGQGGRAFPGGVFGRGAAGGERIGGVAEDFSGSFRGNFFSRAIAGETEGTLGLRAEIALWRRTLCSSVTKRGAGV